MLDVLARKIQGALFMSAHFRSITKDSDDFADEIRGIEQHPGMVLYLTPFWSEVRPVLDERLSQGLFTDVAQADQRLFDLALNAVEALWRKLGITFELMPDGNVFAHVDAPVDY